VAVDLSTDARARVERVFDDALDQPPSTRAAWVRAACGDDAALHREVCLLLAAHDHADGVLDAPRAALLAEAGRARDERAPASPAAVAGDMVGPYRLVSELGRGGMGAVYLAERDDGQFTQRVAVKVLHRGLDSADVVRRFRAERQILAALDHPNIARLLDGGVTADGRPYCVLELVDGEPIDRYCDARRLSIDERVRLVRDVARAVHSAHRSLVVHRDIKPSNVLVTGTGAVKLLDFGIAKLLDPSALPYAAPETRTDVRPMTPEYASPEQVRGGPITTATDVYGLGLVLYELLAGRRAQEPEARSLREIERAVCEREPVRPSVAVLEPPRGLPGLPATADAIAAARATSPARLARLLRGDLDRIVACALRKEPGRRYGSAEELAADLGHYLGRRPVAARGDSLPYRARKFLSRHRWAVAGAAAVVALLAGYAATVTVQTRRVTAALHQARVEGERAEQVTAFTMGLFEAGNAARGETLTARDLLRRGADRAERLGAQPATQAQMFDVVGMAYLRLGDHDAAERYLTRALALRRRVLGDEHQATAESMFHLAGLYGRRGRYARADSLYRDALAVQQRLLGSDHPHVARTLSGLGLLRQQRGDYVAGERLAREALAIRRANLGPTHPDVAVSLAHLANSLQLQGRPADAEPLLRQALALRRRLYGGEHPDVAGTMGNLAIVVGQRGAYAEAESLHRTAHAMRVRFLGPDHPDVAVGSALLGALLRRAGRLGEADSVYRAAIAAGTRALGADHPDLAHMVSGLAFTARDRGDLAAADSLHRAVLAVRRRVLGPTHPAIATSLHQLGALAALRGDTAAAVRLLRDALALRQRALGAGHPQAVESERALRALGGGGGSRLSALGGT
jgi:serine/threonine-protein kinase